VVIVAVVALHVPLGDYLARTFSPGRHWRAEMVLYRSCGIEPDADQRWPDYLRTLLAVSLAGILVLYLLLRAQAWLPYSLGWPAPWPGRSRSRSPRARCGRTARCSPR
jgi:K+-transporting ATPase ATPase A chain